MRIDIFCRVVDNYGDAGVTWRLARQLALEHGARTTLWMDAPQALARLAPRVDPRADDTLCDGVQVRRLDDDAVDVPELPDLVVEGFGCGLPPAYVHAMAKARTQPLWVNLEYLSAESWIESVHGLPSPHPRLPLTRYFFFPGFTRATGGLLRERDVFARRDASCASRLGSLPAAVARVIDAAAQDARAASDPCVVSLFCYANAALAPLLDAWAERDEPMLCLVPEGVATASFDRWLGGGVPHAGERITHGALTLATIPFLAQDEYDALLRACDVNFVRGEDSFVRAQWALAPFVWHIYPQDDDAHRVKLEAFLGRYLADAPAGTADASRRFWRAWNGGDAAAVAQAWESFRHAMPALAAHNARWGTRLAALPDLASSLLDFARHRL
ncbi:MAG TPA: elongation factor P maturation arginine rhamnosyltransferase EarP [Casimicrobiaceae bacterium]